MINNKNTLYLSLNVISKKIIYKFNIIWRESPCNNQLRFSDALWTERSPCLSTNYFKCIE